MFGDAFHRTLSKASRMKIVIRNFMQHLIIALINWGQWLLRSKIMLFSFFMSRHPGRYLFTRGKIGGVDYIVNAQDIAVGRRIFIGLDDEHLKAEKAIAWIKSLSNQEISSIVDIGANIGHITIPLLKRGVVSKAYCYEPDPENYKLLQVNLLLNGLTDMVKCEQIALTREDSHFLLELSENNFGDHRIRKSNHSGSYGESSRTVLKVMGKRLDSVIPKSSLSETEQPLLWLDVQGYEAEVLWGAQTYVFSRNPLVLEFWPYGLNRVNGVGDLINILSVYNEFMDLDDIEPLPRPIGDLLSMYQGNLGRSAYFRDILLI